MRRFLSFLFVFALSAGPLLSAEDPQVDAFNAPKYIGQSVTVSGLVVAVFVSKRGNVFINFGDKYPNQTFTGWIPAGTPLASDTSLQLLQGKTVKITGTIELYHGKPEIKIMSRDQLVSE
jgi:DNA/RNA endonuclease YhcR with UshA esterase domain